MFELSKFDTRRQPYYFCIWRHQSELKSLSSQNNQTYRRAVWKALPHVRLLDDIPMEKEVTAKYPQYSMRKLEDEWNHINNLLEEFGLVSDASVREMNELGC